MLRIPNSALRTSHRVDGRPVDLNARPQGTRISNTGTEANDLFASVFQSGLYDVSKVARSDPLIGNEGGVTQNPARHGPADDSLFQPVATDTSPGEDARTDRLQKIGAASDDAKGTKSEDGSHEPPESVPEATSLFGQTMPDTIRMLNKLMLIGGPSSRASAELRGDTMNRSDMPMRYEPKDIEYNNTESRTSNSVASTGNINGESDLQGLNQTNPEPFATGREPVAGNGQARAPNTIENNPSVLRSPRNNDAQTGDDNRGSRQYAPPVQQPSAESARTVMASLTSFASLHMRQLADTAPFSSGGVRAGTATVAALGVSTAASGAQATVKDAAQPAELAQPHASPTSQMFRGISSALKSDASGGSALISLRPESLGEVKVRVEVRDGTVSASFETATPMARELLNRSLVELRELLHSKGLIVDRVEVSLRDERHNDIKPGTARMDAQQEGRGQTGGPSQDEMGHAAGGESQSQPSPGGAGSNGWNDNRAGRAWMPGRQRDEFSETLESAEPVPGQVGAASVWRVDGLIDTLV